MPVKCQLSVLAQGQHLGSGSDRRRVSRAHRLGLALEATGQMPPSTPHLAFGWGQRRTIHSALAFFQQHRGSRGPLPEFSFIKGGKWVENGQVTEASQDDQARGRSRNQPLSGVSPVAPILSWEESGDLVVMWEKGGMVSHI